MAHAKHDIAPHCTTPLLVSCGSRTSRSAAAPSIIPDSAKEKPQEGKVLAVGKGRVAEPAKDPRWTSRLGLAFSWQVTTRKLRSSER